MRIDRAGLAVVGGKFRRLRKPRLADRGQMRLRRAAAAAVKPGVAFAFSAVSN